MLSDLGYKRSLGIIQSLSRRVQGGSHERLLTLPLNVRNQEAQQPSRMTYSGRKRMAEMGRKADGPL